MKNRLKFLLLMGAACALAPAAYAQGPSIESRLEAMEAQIAQLKAELAAEKAKGESDVILLEQKIQQPLPVGAQSGKSANAGFQVGDTTFKIGGFIDMDAHVTHLSDGAIGSSSIARDFYIPSVTPIGGASTTVSDLTAQASRLSISAQRDVGSQKATAHLEMDFLGSSQGDERVSNSYSPRLRRAYLDYNGLRVGQEWSTFQNTSAIPESASFLALSDGMVFMRQPQIRYTSGNFQVALETGNTTITPAGGSGRIEADGNTIPDVVARYNLSGDYGNISLAAIGRQLRLETGAPSDDSTFGFGVNVAGKVKVGERSDVRFQVAAGEGLGRYIGLNALNGAAINPATGELEAIPSYGGYVAFRQPFGETARFNIGYSALFADNPDFLTALNPASTKSVQSAYGALLWDIAPKITVGAELMYGIKELENGADGSLTRATFSTKYGF